MRAKYTVKDKMKIARKAKATSIHHASRVFKVDRRCLVLQEVRYERSLHHRVTRRRVLELASKVISEMDEKPTLQLSNGWLECFLARHDLVMRRATNKPKLKKEATAARGANFVLAFREVVAEYNITAANIINYDETAVFAEHNKNRTIDVRGATDVPVKSLGLEKVRVTAVFGAPPTHG
ncbi:hypothetical protein ATCC90586_011110 [Pythium insidiosum]|nr:hypothetical protein ATCC90586_011110 [Pythium insidiosum]